MSIAHVCPRCGIDLARVRAQREPHYGVMIVECPGCGRVSARQRHPLLQFWREFRRLDWALSIMAVNLAGHALFAAGTLGLILWFLRWSMDRTLPAIWTEDRLGLAFLLVVWPVALGTWLRVSLAHWRAVVVWLTFAGLVAVGLGVTALGHALDETQAWRLGREAGIVPGLDAFWIRESLELWGRGCALLLLMMEVALLGLLPGTLIARLLHEARRAWWRRQRRRLRESIA